MTSVAEVIRPCHDNLTLVEVATRLRKSKRWLQAKLADDRSSAAHTASVPVSCTNREDTRMDRGSVPRPARRAKGRKRTKARTRRRRTLRLLAHPRHCYRARTPSPRSKEYSP